MRLLNKYDLLALYDTGYGQPGSTIKFTTLTYHGEGYPLEFAVEKIVEVEVPSLKRTIERAASGDGASMPRISMVQTMVKERDLEPVGICWLGDIEKALSVIDAKRDNRVNLNLGVLRLAFNKMISFKEEIDHIETADRLRHASENGIAPVPI